MRDVSPIQSIAVAASHNHIELRTCAVAASGSDSYTPQRRSSYHKGPTRSDTLRVLRHARNKVYGLGLSIKMRVSEEVEVDDVREGVVCKELVRLMSRLLFEAVDGVV